MIMKVVSHRRQEKELMTGRDVEYLRSHAQRKERTLYLRVPGNTFFDIYTKNYVRLRQFIISRFC